MKNIKFAVLSMITFATIITGCGKDNEAPPTYASVLFVNAALTSTATPTTSLYNNDSLYSNGFIGYNANTSYIGVLEGLHTFTLRQDNGTYSALAPIIATDGPMQYNTNEFYSLFSFDSLTTSNKVQFLRLRDDLSVPSAVNFAKVRFLNLAPNYPSPTAHAVDVVFVRYVNYQPVDSLTLPAKSFPNVNSAAENQLFYLVPSGGYVIKLKSPGTQTVLNQVGTSPNPTGIPATPVVGTVTIGSKRILTYYTNGTAAGRAFGVSQITNF